MSATPKRGETWHRSLPGAGYCTVIVPGDPFFASPNDHPAPECPALRPEQCSHGHMKVHSTESCQRERDEAVAEALRELRELFGGFGIDGIQWRVDAYAREKGIKL